jgi:hypothetical protein
VGHAHAIALGVDDGHVRRVPARRAATVEARHVRLLARANLGGEDGRVRLADEVVDGHVHERGIAHVAVLVDGRALHRLGDDADVLGRVVPESGQVEVLEDVQHLEQHDAPAGRLIARHA